MSTLSYSALTTKREKISTKGVEPSATGKNNSYIDAFAALVPAEVLALHAVIISLTTKIIPPGGNVGEKTEIIKDAIPTLIWSFYGLILLSILLYIIPRLMSGKVDKWDILRAIIPPLAFIGWTMLQRTTTFDAIEVKMPISDYARNILPLFLAIILGFAASALAFKVRET